MSALEIRSEAEMVALGRRLAGELPAGSVVSLVGTLGAGKTRLVRAIAEALGVSEEVTSPTFVLVNEYRSGSLPIFHLDAYRLKDEDEFEELGVEEFFASGGLTLVEWGDRVEQYLPGTAVVIKIEVLAGEKRLVEIVGLE